MQGRWWKEMLISLCMAAAVNAHVADGWRGLYNNNPILNAKSEALPGNLTAGQTNYFLELNPAQTNVVFYILAAPPASGNDSDIAAGVRIWSGKEYQVEAARLTNVALAAEGLQFHGTPATGSCTVELWRATWSPPPDTYGRFYYAPWVQGQDGACRMYLVRQMPTTGEADVDPASGAMWATNDQFLASDFEGVDYSFRWVKTAPVKLERLEELIGVLDQHPPGFVLDPVREQAFLGMDNFFESAVQPWQSYDLNREPNEIWQLIERRLFRALDETEAPAADPDALTVWQMYNMGLLVRAGDKVVGMDLIPVSGGSPEFLRRIAALVDVLLVTHPHNDHYSTPLIRACVQAGKPVFMSSSYARDWKGNPNLHPVDEYLEEDVAGINVVGRRGVHIWTRDRNAIHIVYYEVGFPSGRSVIFCGDLDYTMEFTRTPDHAIDLLVLPWRSPSWLYEPGESRQTADRPVAVQIAVERVRPRFILHGHYAELGHVYDGAPASYAVAAELKRTVPVQPAEWMFWGECLLIPAP